MLPLCANNEDCAKIEIFGTGHPFDAATQRKYIGTYQLFEGDLVFHVFELI